MYHKFLSERTENDRDLHNARYSQKCKKNRLKTKAIEKENFFLLESEPDLSLEDFIRRFRRFSESGKGNHTSFFSLLSQAFQDSLQKQTAQLMFLLKLICLKVKNSF